MSILNELEIVVHSAAASEWQHCSNFRTHGFSIFHLFQWWIQASDYTSHFSWFYQCVSMTGIPAKDMRS